MGHWVLRGTIARQSTTHDVTFDWMLGREYVQMHEVSRERAANGKPAYEAVVLFGREPRSGEYACLWLDNTGASAFDPQGIGRGRVAGDSVTFVFHYTPTTVFTPPLSTVVRRTHGSGTWIMTAWGSSTVCPGDVDAAVASTGASMPDCHLTRACCRRGQNGSDAAMYALSKDCGGLTWPRSRSAFR